MYHKGNFFNYVSLSVHPSVRLSRFRVHPVSLEPLVGFTNNSAQMSSTMRRCAGLMFDQGWFKVKVIVQGLTLYDCILSVRCITLEELVTF